MGATFETFPKGAPEAVRLWVPAAAVEVLRTGSCTLRDICDNTGAVVNLEEGGANGSCILVLSGGRESVLHATQLAAAQLAEIGSEDQASSDALLIREGPSAPPARSR